MCSAPNFIHGMSTQEDEPIKGEPDLKLNSLSTFMHVHTCKHLVVSTIGLRASTASNENSHPHWTLGLCLNMYELLAS